MFHKYSTKHRQCKDKYQSTLRLILTVVRLQKQAGCPVIHHQFILVEVNQFILEVHQAILVVHQAILEVHQAILEVHQAILEVHRVTLEVHQYTSQAVHQFILAEVVLTHIQVEVEVVHQLLEEMEPLYHHQTHTCRAN
jgi:hypothetical protein